MLNALSLIALSLVACKDDGDTGDTAPACTVEVSSTLPASGETNFYYRSQIEASLSEADSTAEITMDGVSGTSWLSDDSKTVYFTPDAPLDPSTSYSYTVNYCGGAPSIDFTTSDLGAAIADPSSLVGNVYALDLQADSVRIVIPEDVGSVLEQYLEVALLLEVSAADASEIDMFGAIASEDDSEAQEYCDPTLAFPTADFSGAPYFQLGPQTTTISAAGYSVEIMDLFISGDFAADGSYWGGGVLQGMVDTRPLVPLLEDCDADGSTEDTADDCDDNGICELVEGFGVECEDCGGGENYCLEIRAEGLGGDKIDTDLVEVEDNDCHELCDASAENPECNP
ncbi:MAG: Ig-like domain-containing protein [Myxococcota bacterium]|nr:Ig-like domain-containing protein [Myxococcota bacterium]